MDFKLVFRNSCSQASNQLEISSIISMWENSKNTHYPNINCIKTLVFWIIPNILKGLIESIPRSELVNKCL